MSRHPYRLSVLTRIRLGWLQARAYREGCRDGLRELIRRDSLARFMFDRQAASFEAESALTELAWTTDPDIRAFWQAEADAVLAHLDQAAAS